MFIGQIHSHQKLIVDRRREREEKRAAGGKKTKTTKKKKVGKKPPAKAKKTSPAKDQDEDLPDTSSDAKIAAELALGRKAKNRDVTGVKAKKKAALDKLRKDRIDATANKKEDKEDSDLDYGDDNDDESGSEEDYQPWAAKAKKKPSRVSAGRDDSDNDSDGGRTKAKKAFVEADLSDFVLVTIPRRRLARWCNEPYFEKSVNDFYVRLAIGRDQRTQRPCYRLCKVVGVETGKQYQFDSAPNTNEKSVSAHFSFLHVFFVS